MELSDLEYAGDVPLSSDDPSRLNIVRDRRKDVMCMFGMDQATSKVKMLFEDWISSNPNPFVAGSNWMRLVDLVTRMIVCTSLDGRVSDKVLSCTQNAELAFTNLRQVSH